jgi:hypothetical protein
MLAIEKIQSLRFDDLCMALDNLIAKDFTALIPL